VPAHGGCEDKKAGEYRWQRAGKDAQAAGARGFRGRDAGETAGSRVDSHEIRGLCFLYAGHDPFHGKRAAVFAKTLYGSVIQLPIGDMGLLLEACENHTHGKDSNNVTIQTCWDADRLDLGRVGIRPSPERLCTEAARDPVMLELAYHRSVRGQIVDVELIS